MAIEANAPRCALVTGGTGYLGSFLVRRLIAEGYAVHVLARPKSSMATLDAAATSVTVHTHDGSTRGMIELVGRAKPDVVFHLASLFLAQHTPDDIPALVESNLTFPTQLLEGLAANGVHHLINTSTSWQHYRDAPYSPVNLYAATKQAFEDVVAYYVDANQLKVTTLALFDTYGPNDPRRKLMSLLWRAALTKEPLLMSPGEQLIDLVHVDDVVEAFVMAAKQLPEQAAGHKRYGVSSGRPMRLMDLAATFERATGHTLPITWGGRAYRPREVMRTWTRFETIPGWQPKVPLHVGIPRSAPPIT